MSDTFLAVEVEKNNTVLLTVPENLVVSTAKTELVVTSIQQVQNILTNGTE